MLDFQVIRLNRWRFFWGLRLAKLTQLKTERRRLHRELQLFFLLFNPGKMMPGPALLSPTKQQMRFDEDPDTLGLTEKDIKE
jgi:hypothetical protein